ncbi:MAG: hypothetical protein ACRC3B_21010, partial [Bacteroidia bacterium]
MKAGRTPISIQILLHILFWCVLIGIPIFVRISVPKFREIEDMPIALSVIYNLILISHFYLNAYVYMPRLLYKRRIAAYFGALSTSFLLCVFYLLFINFYYESKTPAFIHTLIGIVSCFFI